MDSELRYEEHIKEAATRGLLAAMCLRRLKILTPGKHMRTLYDALKRHESDILVQL
jgi:hypothetical protein